MSKVRGLIVIIGCVWAMGFIGVMLVNLVGNAANIWTLPASTYQIAITAGIVAVFTYLGTVVFPVIIKPSTYLKLPEA
jgi:hypothetical protein